jgi:hypothetical protein
MLPPDIVHGDSIAINNSSSVAPCTGHLHNHTIHHHHYHFTVTRLSSTIKLLPHHLVFSIQAALIKRVAWNQILIQTPFHSTFGHGSIIKPAL